MKRYCAGQRDNLSNVDPNRIFVDADVESPDLLRRALQLIYRKGFGKKKAVFVVEINIQYDHLIKGQQEIKRHCEPNDFEDLNDQQTRRSCHRQLRTLVI